MDAVLDTSARAAAFAIVIQQLCIDNSKQLVETNKPLLLLQQLDNVEKILSEHALSNEKFIERSVQLIWINNSKATPKDVAKCFLRRAKNLLLWLQENADAFFEKDETGNLLFWNDEDFKKDNSVNSSNELSREKEKEKIAGNIIDPLPSPDSWRNMISKLLYKDAEQRAILAEKINYLPLQIILASGGKNYGALKQRICQEWKTPEKELEIILEANDVKFQNDFEKKNLLAEELLQAEEKLLFNLEQEEVPLSFDYIFDQELEEIGKNRLVRMQEQLLTNNIATSQLQANKSDVNSSNRSGTDTSEINVNSNHKKFKNRDPKLKARQMQLNALAFSGGGIRSATFNLGILQALAKAGYLYQFDYLSTVSGGGYLGSWLASWIKREGSVLKVSNRLNPLKSSNPQAEEVRPIRWLRMYSNYLTPNAGVMSVDSWTVGMTILRNMLLNQLIIFLILFTVLLAGRLLFVFWTNALSLLSDSQIFFGSAILILLGSILAGAGMNFYHEKTKVNSIGTFISSKKRRSVSNGLLAVSCILSLSVSAWLFCIDFPLRTAISLTTVSDFFWISSSVTFVGLLLVAVLGRYDKCVPNKGYQKIAGIFWIIFFSAVAAIAGAVLLFLAGQIIASVKNLHLTGSQVTFPDYGTALAFIIGPPLVAEVLSLTIVIRMALLGKYFPDERREWWGRMGGIIHRIAFLWILIAGAALIGKELICHFLPEPGAAIIAAAGGWGALVIGAVKAAFSSKSSDSSSKPSVLYSVLNILAQAGPYLFGLGLLIIMPVFLNNILDWYLSQQQQESLSLMSGITAVLALITAGLAQRVGVNEFSMHHFYKNRLVRAYLGATRSRSDRKITSSPFTGFDRNDDVLLSDLKHERKYYGPYPILNTTLNASQVSDLDRQDRQGESFVFSPLYCGFDFSRTRSSANAAEKSYDYAYRPTLGYGYPPKGPHLGSAMSISGAAANPNQGFHSSPATAFLLTAFNVRLGWWIGNPRQNSWKSSHPDFGLHYLIASLFGKSNTNDKYVSLSDGGHFDNMGLYELIRRRVSLIVLGDGEQDDKFICEGLANAVRLCRIDFGVEIDIDVTPITNRTENLSGQSFAVGKIIYPGEPPTLGVLIYLKSSITKEESIDIREYGLKNKSFPHQSTGDQFFDEAQFESYRKLGMSVAENALADHTIQNILSKMSNQVFLKT